MRQEAFVHSRLQPRATERDFLGNGGSGQSLVQQVNTVACNIQPDQFNGRLPNVFGETVTTD